MPTRLQVGDIAPDFSLLSNLGETVHLYEQLKQSAVVLFFYPRAFTPVCTAEACGFQDSFADFRSLDATVLGISSDTPETLTRFAEQHRLSFPLLSDVGSRTRTVYAVPKVFGLLPGRVTYVIGKDRRIKKITVASLKAGLHVSESLKSLEETPADA